MLYRVAANTSIGLGALVNGFIRTQEEKCETDKPDIVLRSIRQFMSGTKNYLLNKREPEIDAVIDRVSTHTNSYISVLQYMYIV